MDNREHFPPQFFSSTLFSLPSPSCCRPTCLRSLITKVEGREYMSRVESTCRGTRVKSRVEGKVESKVEGLKMSLKVGKKQKPVPLE